MPIRSGAPGEPLKFSSLHGGDFQSRFGPTCSCHAAPYITPTATSYLAEGHRNVQLTQLAGALHCRGVSEQAADAALQSVNEIDGNPPLPEEEVRGIARSISRYEVNPRRPSGISGVVERSPDRFRLLTIEQLSQLPPAEWLVQDIVEQNRLGIVHGPSETCKSFLTLDLGLCVAAGCDWHGRAVKSGPVVFVAAEGGSGIRKRVNTWKQEHGIDEIPNARFLLEDVQLLSSGDVEGLLRRIQAVFPNPVLIILDTFAACFVGGEENSAKDTGLAIAAARHLVIMTGATVLLVHHSGRQETNRERGSSALKGNVDVMLSVSRDGNTITVKNTKQKDHEGFEPFHLELKQVALHGGDADPSETSCVLTACQPPDGVSPPVDINDSERRALEVLETFGDDGATPKNWRQAIETAHRVNVPDKSFQNWRSRPLVSPPGMVETPRLQAKRRAW